mmetsp:Transcript_19511/g.45310  ORF Transcript_19511/g.45310 Transcript_19511/m.45310 type:complete len:322 (-) Transcript_19511:179-1144(-)
MGRGKESKERRKASRKGGEDVDAGRLFVGDGELKENGSASDFSSIPLPPGMAAESQANDDSDDSSEESGERNDAEELHVIRKKKAKQSSCCADDACPPKAKKSSSNQGIKTTPLILLILMVGTTILPGLIYASDYIGGYLAKNNVMGQIGFRLGMGAVPKKRVLSFYEKHDPEKLNEVPTILSKYYGDYPKLIKRLERKYQDYGYFLGWESDEAPMALAKDQLQETYSLWINSYWNVYAPQPAKTAARNIRYNLTFLHKKFYKIFWKKIWPHLEPFLGVPDGTEKQKRKDRAEAQKRRQKNGGASSGRTSGKKKFRDDVDE